MVVKVLPVVIARRLAFSMVLAWTLCHPAWAGLTMAIYDFTANGVPAYLGPAVSEVIRTEMASTPGVDLVVVDRNHLRKAAQEQRIGMSGLVDPATAARVGRLVGARYVVVGSVNSLGGEISIESRIVDVETGVVLESFSSVSDNGEEGLPSAAGAVAGDIKVVLVSPD